MIGAFEFFRMIRLVFEGSKVTRRQYSEDTFHCWSKKINGFWSILLR